MRWPWRCSRRAASLRRISRARIPGGALGRKLLLHVADVMRGGDELPIVSPDATLAEGPRGHVEEGPRHVRRGRPTGACRACSPTATFAACSTATSDVHGSRMSEVMTSPGKRVKPSELAAEAAHLMEKHRITALPVVDDAGAARWCPQRARPAACRSVVSQLSEKNLGPYQVPLRAREAAGARRGRRAHRRPAPLRRARRADSRCSTCATGTASSRWPGPASRSPSFPAASPPPSRAARRDLGIKHVFQGVDDKTRRVPQAGDATQGRHSKNASASATTRPTLPLLDACGLGVAVADAHADALAAADLVTTRNGGQGAVREVCDWLMAARA